MSPKQMLRILMVEDVPDDAELISYELRSSDIAFVSERVDEKEKFVGTLSTFMPDIILSDYRLPAFSGEEALSITLATAPDVPFIFVTGALREDHAVELMKKGATDFVLKDRLSRLPLCVNRALQEAEDKRGLRQAEDGLKKAHADLQAAYERLKEETEERLKAEQQLRQAVKMEALGTLTGGIAHDFNNILAAIIGFAELTAEDIPKGSLEAHNIEKILQAGLRGRTLVKQMLTFSRKAEQEKKPLQLAGIARETVTLLRASIPKTIDIKVDVTNESALMLGDPGQVQQILMNLCTNASFAMRERGGILRIELDDYNVSPDGGLHGLAPGSYLQLTVRDTGTGMAPEIIGKIFDPFFTTKQVGEGTGLGLSVVHGIVRQHNGHITVESEPGRGSVFKVYFPRIVEELPRTGSSPEPILRGTERVLFVDDEEILVEMGKALLERLGYRVTTRTSSTEALSLIKSDPLGFDLIITDQTMPDMTGMQMARQALTLRNDIPIILCTGYSENVSPDTAREAGIRAFLMKPLQRLELARAVREALGSGKGEPLCV